jgi:hypothetical protein
LIANVFEEHNNLINGLYVIIFQKLTKTPNTRILIVIIQYNSITQHVLLQDKKGSDCIIRTPKWRPAQPPLPQSAVFPWFSFHGNMADSGGLGKCREGIGGKCGTCYYEGSSNLM